MTEIISSQALKDKDMFLMAIRKNLLLRV